MNNIITEKDCIKALEDFKKIAHEPIGKDWTGKELLKARKSQIPDGAIIISV